jgi:hypothetical protein
MGDAEHAKNNAQRVKALSEIPGELRTTPTRGVDPDVVKQWLSMVTAIDTLNANQKRINDGDLAAEAVLRGLMGDPFGTARDAQLREKVNLEEFRKTFLELKNMASVLTAKYGTEFPVP